MQDQRYSTFGAARRLAANALERRRSGLRRCVIVCLAFLVSSCPQGVTWIGSHDLDPAKPLDALSRPGRFLLVNYLGTAIGEEKFGQFSPLAAYDTATDRF